MRVRPSRPSPATAMLALLSIAGAALAVRAHAEPQAESSPTSPAEAPGRPLTPSAPNPEAVVARVGDRVLTVREVERRIAQVPSFQLQAFGKTAEEIRRNFVESVLVRELLLSDGALAQKTADRPDVQERIRGVLRNAMVSRIRGEVAAESEVTDADVSAYYEANRAKFSSPPRVAIWRILVATRGEAEAILAELKKDLSPNRWNQLAREKSLDPATSMRGGNLGFVRPDGTTAEPAMKVDPHVLEAVARVNDAELVGEPVPEGDRFAVVWRRQSMKGVNRTLDQEAPAIRQVIAHTRTEARLKDFLAKLRAQELTSSAPELVELIDVDATGDLQPVRRPGTLASSRRQGAPPPSPVPRRGDLR